MLFLATHSTTIVTSRAVPSALALAGILVLGACGGTLKHTVSDDAIQRVKGEDRAMIDASTADVKKLEAQISASDGKIAERKSAIDDAESKIAKEESNIQSIEEKLGKARQAHDRALRVKELREVELRVAELEKKAAQAAVVHAQAKLELDKFNAVGRVESGSDAEFQERLAQFQGQLAEKQVELSEAQERVAAEQRHVEEISASL